MRRDVLTDHIIGCLSGFCIGNALGRQGEGMTPWQIVKKYNYIDGLFQNSVNGRYSKDVEQIISLITYIVENNSNKSNNAEIIKEYASKNELSFITKAIVVGLISAVLGIEDKEIGILLKKSNLYKTKHEAIGILLISIIIRESIRNYATLQRPFDLYDSEFSLLSKLISVSSKAEESFESSQEDSFSERIGLVKSRLSRNSSLMDFSGFNGTSDNMFEQFSLALFSFLREPDEFKTIYKLSSIGGSSSLNAGLCGAFIGGYVGNSFISEKDILEDSAKINILASSLVQALWPEPIEEEFVEKIEEID